MTPADGRVRGEARVRGDQDFIRIRIRQAFSWDSEDRSQRANSASEISSSISARGREEQGTLSGTK